MRSANGPAEIWIGHRAAFAVVRRVRQVAVRHEVAVGIGPVPRRLQHEAGNGVAESINLAATEILVERGVQRRLPIAEQVVRGAHLRRHVFPRELILFRERDVSIRQQRERRAEVLLGEMALLVVEPHAAAQRQPVNGPPVLREDAHVGVQFPQIVIRPRAQRDLIRHAVIQPIRHGVENPVVVVGRPGRIAEPDLERVGARDIRRSHPVAQRIVESPAISGCARLEVDAGRLFGEPDRQRVLILVWKPSPLVQLIERAGLEQQPVGHRSGPVAGHDALRVPPAVVGTGLERGRRIEQRWTLTRVLLAPRDRQLVLLRRLPRQACLRIAPVRIVGDAPLRIGVEAKHRQVVGGRIMRHAADIRRSLEITHRRVEPQPIATHGTTEPRIGIAVHLDRVRIDEPAIAQIVGQVTGRHALIGKAREQRPVEQVAAVARDDVQTHPAFRRLRRHGRRIDRNFLRGAQVRRVRGFVRLVRPPGRQAVEVHPKVSVLTAMDRQVRRRITTRTAHSAHPGR